MTIPMKLRLTARLNGLQREVRSNRMRALRTLRFAKDPAERERAALKLMACTTWERFHA
jgi:hypothetical protein